MGWAQGATRQVEAETTDRKISQQPHQPWRPTLPLRLPFQTLWVQPAAAGRSGGEEERGGGRGAGAMDEQQPPQTLSDPSLPHDWSAVHDPSTNLT